MCNLYDIGPAEDKRNQTVWERLVFGGFSKLSFKQFGTRKTDLGLAITNQEHCEVMRWGFERSFNPSINNAREDKLNGPMWHDAWSERRRCIIPISTYYEWSGPTGQKQTHAFQSPQDSEWLWAGGLWEDHVVNGPCYTMLTVNGSQATRHIHDRMPAFLSAEQLEPFLTADDPREWLSPTDRLRIFRSENPLKNPDHDGPIAMNMLPGFE